MGLPFLFILNPNSNRGKAGGVWPVLQRELERRQVRYELATTNAAGDAVRVASERAFDCDTIVAVGGDGTVHEIANGLMLAKQSNHHAKPLAALGIVPCGSGNDFVKMLAIPTNQTEAVRYLLQAQPRTMDLGAMVVDREHERYFINNVGIGFDAYVNAESLKIRLLRGILMYLAAALLSVFKYRHPLIRYAVNGRTMEEKLLLLTAGNGRCSGGGFYITPEAKIDDGMLDICIIRSLSRRGILLKLPKVMAGSHTALPEVTLLRTTEISMDSVDGLPIHADGEVVSLNAHHIQIRVVPSAIRVAGTIV